MSGRADGRERERWLRGDDRNHAVRRDQFDLEAEGARHGIDRDLAHVLWERALAEATDAAGRLDEELAQRRFLEMAALLAERRGWPRPEVGKLTRSGAAGYGNAPAPGVPGRQTLVQATARRSWQVDPAARGVPGRTTLVQAEAWRWVQREDPAVLAPAARRERPGAADVVPSMAAPATAGREAARSLDPAVADRMSRLFGVALSGVQVVPDSVAATGSSKALTKDGAVHFRAGAYRPGTTEGDWLIAHELAHVVQQRGGRGERTGTRSEIEREADRAASFVARGQFAPIVLRAQPGASYAFNEGEAHDEAAAHPPDARESHPGAPDGADAGSPELANHLDDARHAGDGSHDQGDRHDAVAADEHAIRVPLPADDAPGDVPAVDGGPAPRPLKHAPSVVGVKPEAGLAQLRGVRPDMLTLLFGRVRTANATDVSKARAAQHANPPRQVSTAGPMAGKAGAAPAGAASAVRESATAAGPMAGKAGAAPVGAASVAKGSAAAGTTAGTAAPDHAVKAEVPGGEAAKKTQQDQATLQREAVIQVVDAVKRSIASWFASWFSTGKQDADEKAPRMSEAEAQQAAGSVDRLPTTASDISSDMGPAPELAMKGEAKGATDKDRAELEHTTTALETLGRADSRAPMDEDHIEPTVPPPELIARPAGGAGTSGPGASVPLALPTVAGAAPSEEVGNVAQEQHGAEIDVALGNASADITAERGRHESEEGRVRAESDAQIRELKAKADAEQTAARAAAQTDVTAVRAQWQAEIDQQGADARRRGDRKVAEGIAQVEAEETKANAEARRHIEDGKQKADHEKQKGEREAAEAKEDGKHRSSGFWGWARSKAQAAFDGIKKAVASAIDACRRAVKTVIAAAKKLAVAAIELARKVITGLIQAIGKALVAIGDVLLATFPELKARFQDAIRKAVDKATAAVNRIADGLKHAVQTALDQLGVALDQALELLENGIDAIIDAANAVVQGAIQAAQAVVETLGTWARLIKDITSAPGAWLGKLGAAIVDGIKHHLWSTIRTTVIEWFKSKLFELLGIGGAILQLLVEGGLTREHILELAMDALMVAVPAALVAILIEKLVAMIVPAAGALMAVIEGLQAAWGTISRVVAAFTAFMAFLLAVKSGGAGPLFAATLAGAAVVVLDFVASWLLKKLASAARKVGAKLNGLAEKLKGKRKPGPDAKTPKAHPDEHDQKSHDDQRKKKERNKRNQEVLARAERELPPKVQAALKNRPAKLLFRARLMTWRLQYKLTSLTIVPSKNQFKIEAAVNPKALLAGGYEYEEAELLLMLKRVGDRLLRENPKALARAAKRADHLGIDPSKAKAQRAYAPGSAEERIAIASHERQQQPEREPRDRTLVHHGEVQDGTHVRSVHEKPGGVGKRKQGDELVRSVNEDETASNAKRYRELAKILEDRGMTSRQLGQAMRMMSQGFDPPPHVKGSEKEFGELMGLFFGTEPSRDSRNAVHSMMAIELLERGGPGTTISGIFDKLPAEMKGHVKATEALDADLAGHERPAAESRPQQERDVTELKHRQLAQLEAWFRMQIAGARTPLSTSVRDLETFIEDMVRRFIRTYKR